MLSRLGDRKRAAAFTAIYNHDILRLPALVRLAQLSESILDGTQSGELNTGGNPSWPRTKHVAHADFGILYGNSNRRKTKRSRSAAAAIGTRRTAAP